MINKWIPGPKFYMAVAAFIGVMAGEYADVHWLSAVSAGIGATLVYLVPNPSTNTGNEAVK